MKITILVNDISTPPFSAEHGLSLFIETERHKILFDMGKSDLFIENAVKLAIDITEADVAVLSHGHYDHGGGLPAFMEKNRHASIYIHQRAFEEYYARDDSGKIDYIGISPKSKQTDRVIFTSDQHKIDDTLLLFSSPDGNRLLSESNNVLLMKCSGNYEKDSFSHEQNLLIQENGKRVLVTGCAHRGIANILERAVNIAGGPMDAVIGGFHLSDPGTNHCEPQETIDGIADYFLSFPTDYYTCHCTGTKAYQLLKSKMCDRIDYVTAGTIIKI